MVSVLDKVYAPAALALVRVGFFETSPSRQNTLARNPELAKPPVPQSLQKMCSQEDLTR